MKEQELIAFVDSIKHYFEKLVKEEVVVGIPNLISQNENLSELTGAIGIAGKAKGALYLTGPRKLFEDLIAITNPVADTSDVENIHDLVGEMVNVIAGQAQKNFRLKFEISVPMVLTSSSNVSTFVLREPKFIVPLSWQGHQFNMVVGIAET